jgi:hypothetical protein
VLAQRNEINMESQNQEQLRKTAPFSQAANTLALFSAVILCNMLLADSAFAIPGAQEPWKEAYTSPPFAGGVIRDAFCDILGLLQGNLGALLATAAAVVAITSAAMGNLRGTSTLVLTGVAAVTLSAGISVGFGDFNCANDGGAIGGNERTISADIPPVSQAQSPAEDPFQGF